jgi:hypothetical protein
LALISETGELLVRIPADLAGLDDFLARCGEREIGFPRIFCDFLTAEDSDLLKALLDQLEANSSDAWRCVAYLPSGEISGIDESALRQVLASVYVSEEEDSDLENLESRLSRIAAVHRIPSVQSMLFWREPPFLRIADARPIDISGQPQDDLETDRLGKMRRVLLPTALHAAELVLSDLREELKEFQGQVDSMVAKRLWVAWEEAKEVFEVADYILGTDGREPPDFGCLRRLGEAELLLGEAIDECRQSGINEFEAARWLSLETSVERLGDLGLELKKVYNVAKSWMLDFGVVLTPRMSLRFSKAKFWGWPLRITRLPQAREACKKLFVFLERTIGSANFYHRFVLHLFDRVWHKYDEKVGALSPVMMPDLKDVLRTSLGKLWGARVVLALPRAFHEESEEVRRWVEERSGIPCMTVAFEGPNGWLYWEDVYNGHGAPIPLSRVSRATLEEPPKPLLLPLESADGTTVAEEQVTAAVDVQRRPPADCLCETPLGDTRLSAPKVCRRCGGYNSRAWWKCSNHGKIAVDVSTADERCPQCIERHYESPDVFPVSSISLRPDLRELVLCPNCIKLREEDDHHSVFKLPIGLVVFFREGVRGEDYEKYIHLSRQIGLPDDFRCPYCRTLLIPVHHRGGTLAKPPQED